MKLSVLIPMLFVATIAIGQTTTIPKSKNLKSVTKELTTKENKSYELKTNEVIRESQMELDWRLTYPKLTTTLDGTKITTRIFPNNMENPNLFSDLKTKPKDKGTIEKNGNICKAYSISLSPGAASFDAPLANKMAFTYPGAAYNYNEYIKNNVQPSHNRSERNPIILQVSSASGNGKQILVEDPTINDLQETVANLKEALPKQANNLTTEIYVQTIVNNASFALNIEAGGGAFGFEVAEKLGLNYDSRKTYMSIDAKQKNYIITANRPDRAEGGFYIDEGENAKNENVYMSSVTYGRRVIGVIITELDERNIELGVKGSFDILIASANVGLEIIDKLSKEKTSVRLLYIGGKGDVIEISDASSTGVLDKINKWLTNTDAQSAVPVEYTFKNMQDIGMRWESITDNINYEQCVPKPAAWDISVTLNSIEDNIPEKVKLGIQQFVGIQTSAGWINENSGNDKPIICWMEGWNGCQPPPLIDFNGPYLKNSTTYNYTISNEEYEQNPILRINSTRIVMYATNIGGSKNDNNKIPFYDISIKDIEKKSTFNVPVHVNGRIFNFKYTVSVKQNTSVQ